MLGQMQGATSGMAGPVTHEGAKALSYIWETRDFEHSTSKHRVPRPAALSEHCSLTVLLHATSRFADPAASGTLGYEREAVALHCKCAWYRLYGREAPGRSQARVTNSVSMADCLQADLSQQRHWRSHTSWIALLTPAAWERAGRDTAVIPQTAQV